METLSMIGEVFSNLLPICGVAVLIALLVILIRVVQILNSLKKSMKTVDDYITGLAPTFNMVNNLSMSIEAIRFTLEQIVKKAIAAWNDEYEAVKQMLTSLLDKITKKGQPAEEQPAEEAEGEQPVEEADGEQPAEEADDTTPIDQGGN